MTAYSSLSHAQLEDVTYLFADHIFGTDPAAYEYRLDDSGVVIGRCAIFQTPPQKDRPGRKPKATQTAHALPVPARHLTDEQILQARLALKHLARLGLERYLNERKPAAVSDRAIRHDLAVADMATLSSQVKQPVSLAAVSATVRGNDLSMVRNDALMGSVPGHL